MAIVEHKEIYRDDSQVRRDWRTLEIAYEVNGGEYHTEVMIVLPEPIVAITILCHDICRSEDGKEAPNQ